MRTKNKNYKEYIYNYNDSWKSTLDKVSEMFKIDTNGGTITSNPFDSKEECLVIYNNNDKEAYNRNEKFRITTNTNKSFVYQDYGPAYLVIRK